MKKVIFFIIVAVSLLIINNLSHSIIDLWQKQAFLTTEQSNLQKEKQKNQELKQQLSIVSQKQFVEEQARDKLLLIKPGETVVLIPTEMMPQDEQLHISQNISLKPHIEEWWDYFFN